VSFSCSHRIATPANVGAKDAITLDELESRDFDKLAMVLGTEGAGMLPETLAGVELKVMIPMRAGVDSLNVAAASAVAFWACRPD
jgi:tRNA G18 (ribose-2'-O)-methylase SpoU